MKTGLYFVLSLASGIKGQSCRHICTSNSRIRCVQDTRIWRCARMRECTLIYANCLRNRNNLPRLRMTPDERCRNTSPTEPWAICR